jgi:hypothetical protein
MFFASLFSWAQAPLFHGRTPIASDGFQGKSKCFIFSGRKSISIASIFFSVTAEMWAVGVVDCVL